MRKSAFILAFALAAAPALAQSAHIAPPPLNDFADGLQVQDFVNQAKAQNKAAPRPLIAKNLINVNNYQVNAEYRTARAPAVINDIDEELVYVVDGKGNLITGGTIPGAQRDDTRTQSGATVAGGKTRFLTPGAVFVVEKGVPFQIEPLAGSGLVLASMRLAPRSAN